MSKSTWTVSVVHFWRSVLQPPYKVVLLRREHGEEIMIIWRTDAGFPLEKSVAASDGKLCMHRFRTYRNLTELHEHLDDATIAVLTGIFAGEDYTHLPEVETTIDD